MEGKGASPAGVPRIPQEALVLGAEVAAVRSKVYEGTWDGRNVAVKVINGESISGMDTWKGEYDVLVRLAGCKNVVRLLAVATEGGKASLVFERLPRSLQEAIDSKRLTLRDICQKIGPSLATALGQLRGHRVAHLNLTPSNFLVDEDLNVRICGFGVSRILPDDGNGAGGAAAYSSPNYMSPEQWDSNGSPGVEADIWAGAAVLCHCVTGKPPFAQFQDKVMEIAKEVYVNGRPPEVPEALPQGIREVLLKCFRKNQAERATPEELREAFERFGGEVAEGVVAGDGQAELPAVPAVDAGAWEEGAGLGVPREGQGIDGEEPGPLSGAGEARGRHDVFSLRRNDTQTRGIVTKYADLALPSYDKVQQGLGKGIQSHIFESILKTITCALEPLGGERVNMEGALSMGSRQKHLHRVCEDLSRDNPDFQDLTPEAIKSRLQERVAEVLGKTAQLGTAFKNKDQGGDVFRKVKEEVTRIMNDYMVAIEKWLRVRVGKGSDRMQAFADFSNAVRGPETDEMGNMTRRQFKEEKWYQRRQQGLVTTKRSRGAGAGGGGKRGRHDPLGGLQAPEGLPSLLPPLNLPQLQLSSSQLLGSLPMMLPMGTLPMQPLPFGGGLLDAGSLPLPGLALPLPSTLPLPGLASSGPAPLPMMTSGPSVAAAPPLPVTLGIMTPMPLPTSAPSPATASGVGPISLGAGQMGTAGLGTFPQPGPAPLPAVAPTAVPASDAAPAVDAAAPAPTPAAAPARGPLGEAWGAGDGREHGQGQGQAGPAQPGPQPVDGRSASAGQGPQPQEEVAAQPQELPGGEQGQPQPAAQPRASGDASPPKAGTVRPERETLAAAHMLASLAKVP